jgi:hypothetical protein
LVPARVGKRLAEVGLVPAKFGTVPARVRKKPAESGTVPAEVELEHVRLERDRMKCEMILRRVKRHPATVGMIVPGVELILGNVQTVHAGLEKDQAKEATLYRPE